MTIELVELVKEYVGGQMEVQNPTEKYMYRGEIETISIENNELKVRLAWLAQGKGYPPLPQKWVKADRLDYEASLEVYSPCEIGVGRIVLHSSVTNETVALFPPNGSKLDASKVEGLELRVKK